MQSETYSSEALKNRREICDMSKAAKAAKIDLSKFKYRRRRSFPLDGPASFGLLSPIANVQDRFPAFSHPNLSEIGLAMGFSKTREQEALLAHQKRYNQYKLFDQLLSGVFYVFLLAVSIFAVIVIIGSFMLALGWTPSNPDPLITSLAQPLAYLLLSIVIFLALQTADRISSTILSRYYADTLSLVACLYLIIQLAYKDSLSIVEDRNVALKRIRSLRNNIILLSYQYASSDIETNRRIRRHFMIIDYFLGEEEEHIATPISTTRRKILADLFPLAKILLTRQYGKLKDKFRQPESTGAPKSNPIFRWTGIVVPIFIILLLRSKPDLLQFLGLDNKLIALGCTVWFFLSIDSILNLRMFDRIVELAKAIKDLK